MEVEINIPTGTVYDPHLAILVYKQRDAETFIANAHPMIERHGELQIGEAHPFTTSTIRDLVKGLGGLAMQIVPPHVVAVSPSGVAWFEPARERVLYFAGQDKALCGISGQLFPQPPMLFLASPGQLYAFALRENERPGPDTPLMRAPHYNVFSHGAVCRGTVQYPSTVDPMDVSQWSDAYFGSNFSHNSSGSKLVTFDGTHAELWIHMKERGTFDSGVLVPFGKTLKEVLA